ncbi:hypothetical protein [Hyphomonas sp.]|uniref:hypothetical protein n=1 Tax=Hyphomonas sp. TaxID=87 RepID=UPI0030FAED4E
MFILSNPLEVMSWASRVYRLGALNAEFCRWSGPSFYDSRDKKNVMAKASGQASPFSVPDFEQKTEPVSVFCAADQNSRDFPLFNSALNRS